MANFEVKIEYLVTETYELKAKDADVARMMAEAGNRAPASRDVSGKNVVSVKRLGPRYELAVYANTVSKFDVMDAVSGEVVATARYEDVAKTLLDALNKEEEER